MMIDPLKDEYRGTPTADPISLPEFTRELLGRIAEALGIPEDVLGFPQPTLLELAAERFESQMSAVAERWRMRQRKCPMLHVGPMVGSVGVYIA